jgi:hypothetical protein
MTTPIDIPLYDPKARPASWNERMCEGQYAVHYSAFYGTENGYCTVCDSVAEAVAYAREQVAQHPALRCMIYDVHGFVGAPIKEIRGTDFKDRGEISSRFRRWLGGILFVGGGTLAGYDWSHDFYYMWPSTLGTRMLLPGLILLMTEGIVMLYARRKSSVTA